MKKVILGLAVLTALFTVSCKENKQDKVDETTENVVNDADATVGDATEVVDSTAEEVVTDSKDAAADVENTEKEVKEVVKK